MTNKTAFDKISKLIRKAEKETCSQVRVPVELLKEILAESNKLEIDIAEARHDLAEDRWIPVADHLPEVGVWKSVNCWVAWFNEHANKMEVQKLRYVREIVRGKDICRWKSDWGLFHESVIAWMPIKPPQPPKEGEQR